MSQPSLIAAARCCATVVLSRPVMSARRRTPTRQWLPSRSMNSECANSTRRVVAGGPWVLMNSRSQANTSLTRCGMAGSDVTLKFGGGDVAAAAVLVDRELAGADALVER